MPKYLMLLVNSSLLEEMLLKIVLVLMNINVIISWDLSSIGELYNQLNCIHTHFRDADDETYQALNKLQIPIEITKSVNVTPLTRSKCNHIMLEIKSMHEIPEVYEKIASRAGYLFLLFSTEPIWSDILAVAKHYWLTHRIYKVMYVLQKSTRFYHPFLVGDLGEYGVLIDAIAYNISSIFWNQNGHPLRVYIFDSIFSKVIVDWEQIKIIRVDGVDGKVAYVLEKLLNFTMELQWPDSEFFGSRLDNGSFDGAIGRMIRDETDITLSGFFVKDYLTHDFQFSVSVYMDKMCCYVIKAKRIPPSILPLYAVHESIWFAYIAVGILSSFAWMLLRSANLRWNCNPEDIIQLKAMRFQCLDIFTDTWVLWMRMIILRFPPSNAERIFVISLCLVSVIIGAIVESSLATVYTTPRYYKDISTLEELEKANLRILYKHSAIKDDLFTGQNSETYQKLDQRMMLVGEPEERLIEVMAKRGGFAAVTRWFSLEMEDIYYFITNKVYMIPECPKLYNIAFLLAKQSPYEEVVNAGLLEILAAGLFNHWIEMERHRARSRIHLFRDYVAETDHTWKVFNIVDLQLSFYVLVSGLILSALLFLIEWAYNYYIPNKQQTTQQQQRLNEKTN